MNETVIIVKLECVDLTWNNPYKVHEEILFVYNYDY